MNVHYFVHLKVPLLSLSDDFFFNEMSFVIKLEDYCSLCRTGEAHGTLESSSQSIVYCIGDSVLK